MDARPVVRKGCEVLPRDFLGVNFPYLPADLDWKEKNTPGTSMWVGAWPYCKLPLTGATRHVISRLCGPDHLRSPSCCWRRWSQPTAPDSQRGCLLSRKSNRLGLSLNVHTQLLIF